MGEIKSAREIAAEKLEKLGDASETERLRWKYVPEGEQLAGKYIRGNADLAAEIKRYDEAARKHVADGAVSVLIRNISLPTSEAAIRNARQAMDGIRLLKRNQAGLEAIFNQLKHIFDHYSGQGKQQSRQAYESFKAEFEMQVRQALQQQLGTLDKLPIKVEKQPQFQAEWRRRQAKFDAQYLKLLDELKHNILALD